MKRGKNARRICNDCGVEYRGGKYSKYCPVCRTKRQVIGKNDNFEDERQSFTNLVFVRRVKEPLPTYEECPNYCKDFVRCVTCPAGAWKYKDCGRVK